MSDLKSANKNESEPKSDEKADENNSQLEDGSNLDDILGDFMGELEANRPLSKKEQYDKKRKEMRFKDKDELIDYLIRPAAKYGNLNPFDVLDIDLDCTIEEVKARYRQVIFR